MHNFSLIAMIFVIVKTIGATIQYMNIFLAI